MKSRTLRRSAHQAFSHKEGLLGTQNEHARLLQGQPLPAAPHGAAMRHALVSHLQARRAQPSLIDAWEDASQQAEAEEQRPPCPECFIAGSVVGLEPVQCFGDLDQVRCPRCRTDFLFARE